MTRFIAFSGKKQSGKDTAGKICRQLLEQAGHKVHATVFAEPLKDICVRLLGVSKDLVYGSDQDKETLTRVLWDNLPNSIRIKYQKYPFLRWVKPRTGPMTIRELLQVLGTDIFRKMIYDKVWAEAPFNQNYGDTDVVILTDLRFPNEKICTEEYGGVIIRLERETGLNDNHLSETALDGFEFKYHYANNGSLDDLRSFIRNVLTENKFL